jgi:hypothetical protein
MQSSLEGYLEKEIPGADFTLYYHIGDSFSGETDFRLGGDGSYALWSTVTEGRQRRDYTGQLATAQVEALVQDMLAAEIWKVKHVRSKPGEDDPLAIIGAKAGQQDFQVVLWVSEIRRVPSFVEVQDKILRLVHDISAGQVLETGK